MEQLSFSRRDLANWYGGTALEKIIQATDGRDVIWMKYCEENLVYDKGFLRELVSNLGTAEAGEIFMIQPILNRLFGQAEIGSDFAWFESDFNEDVAGDVDVLRKIVCHIGNAPRSEVLEIQSKVREYFN
jgi:hypothetical protein